MHDQPRAGEKITYMPNLPQQYFGDIPADEMRDIIDGMEASRAVEPSEDIFGEPISVYSDAQAIEDGFLIAIDGPGRVNRATGAVFDHFAQPIGDPRFRVFDLTPLMDAIRAILKVEPDDGWRVGDYQGKRLWLIPNELGGLTLMFPEDY